MNKTRFRFALPGIVLTALMTGACRDSRSQDVRVDVGAEFGIQAGVEVLARGPVHEGFAEPVVFEASAGVNVVAIPRDPPALIAEDIPASQPADVGAVWIPGYWAWDDDGKNFIWITGVWRVPPPGHVWIAGYWTKVDGNWRWVAGFWAPAENTQVEYLPEPPAIPADAGPPDAVLTGRIWVPGIWIFQGGAYGWRAGYWLEPKPDWVWMPAHYVHTPGGVLFVDGYWDVAIDRRGVLFAPVSFGAEVRLGGGFRLTPSVVIDVGVFSDHLFARPAFSHYYFGDYYADTYWNAGIYPAFAFHMSRYGYDPIFATASISFHSGDLSFAAWSREHYTYRREHEDARPPRTFSDERRRGPGNHRPEGERANGHAEVAQIAVPLKEVSGGRGTKLKLEPVKEDTKKRFAESENRSRQSVAERQKEESAGAPQGGREGQKREVRQVKLTSAMPAPEKKETAAAPARPEAPKIDPNVKPAATKQGAEPSRLREPELNKPNDRGERAAGERGGQKPDAGKPEGGKPAGQKPEAGKPNQPEGGRNEGQKPDPGRPNPNPQPGRSQPAKPEPGKPESRPDPRREGRPEGGKPEQNPGKPEGQQPKPQQQPPKPQQQPQQQPKPQQPKPQEPKPQQPKPQEPKPQHPESKPASNG